MLPVLEGFQRSSKVEPQVLAVCEPGPEAWATANAILEKLERYR